MDPELKKLFQQYIVGLYLTEADKEVIARMLIKGAQMIREAQGAYERAYMEAASERMLIGQAFGL